MSNGRIGKSLLDSFDALTPDNQDFVIREMLKRSKMRVVPESDEDYGPISEEVMLEIADEGFQRLDQEEDAIGEAKTR